MSSSDASVDWRIARFGAFAALAGTAVGALSSLVIAWWGFEREEDASNRAAEEKAYVEFLGTADMFVNHFRYDGMPQSKETPTFDEIRRLQGLISIYGDGDVLEATRHMIVGMTTGLDSVGEGDDKKVDDAAWDAYDEARTDFIIEAKEALDIDFDL